MTSRFEQAFIDLAEGKPLDDLDLALHAKLKLQKSRASIAGAEIAVDYEDPVVQPEELLEASLALLAIAESHTEKIAQKIAAEEKLLDFCEYIDHTYQRAPHLEIIADALAEVEKFVASGGTEGIGRLMISVPPRHGKTQTVSKRWPAHLLGKNPLTRIALISYGQDLALEASREVREVIRSNFKWPQIFPDVTISDDSQSVSRWSVAQASVGDPSCVAVGVGGPLIGRGFHYIIVDDPIKGRAEAESETIRNGLHQWYSGTLYHRLEPGGAIVIIQTRWHEDDLSGWLLDAMDTGEGEEWVHINLPAMAEEDDPLGREAGAALWPVRYPLENLKKIKKVLGSYDWESLFQGNPKPPEGAKINRAWFKYIEPKDLPDGLQWKRYWDLAVTAKTGSSRTASCRVAFDIKGNLYVSGMIKGKWEWPEQRRVITQTMLAERVIGVEHGIEKAIHGIAVVQEFRQNEDLRGVAFGGVDVHADKLTRALPWIALAQDEKVFLVEGNWIGDFLDEAVVFTGHHDKYDDQIDSVSGGVEMASHGLLVLESGLNPFYD